MKFEFIFFTIAAALFLSACTQLPKTPTPSPLATSTPTDTPSYSPSPSISPSASPHLSATPKSSTKSKNGSSSVNVNTNTNVNSNSSTTSNSTTNINITSNGTNVKITTENGKRYAEVNGQKIELDANGCYDYNQNGTKIHACVNG